jgi:hypothetical protein
MTTTTDLIQHTEQIRNLNDSFRRGFHYGDKLGRIVLTRGVQILINDNPQGVIGSYASHQELAEKVQAFDSFDEANDPHGEHDFFAFDFRGKKLFAKIDYYDTNYEFGSANPADPSQTRRVLTLMLSEEY